MNKHERQLHHVVSGSITKSAGKWNLKAGGEFRAYLANYIDAQTSAVYTLNSSFTLSTVNSSGGQVGTVTVANGGNPWASFLLGAGSVGIPQTNAIHPAFLHQYAAIYTQNDWRPTEKLTLNIGLRWDWQPGVEERYNRIAAVDLNATNPFGGKGSIYFPGANGNSRRLWDTDWSNFQPRLGFAYRPSLDTVVRGGAGVTFLPSNTGFFDVGSFVALWNHGFSTYHALQGSLHKDFSHGLLVGTNFTWSKSLGVDGGLAQNNFAAEGSYNSFPNLRSVRLDKRLSPNDTPIRFASYGVYDLPFGQGKMFSPQNAFVRGLVSGYRLGGTYIWQSGVPQQVSFTGSLNGLLKGQAVGRSAARCTKRYSRPSAVTIRRLRRPVF